MTENDDVLLDYFAKGVADGTIKITRINDLYLCNKCNCYMLNDHVCMPPLSMDYGDYL